jgi:hypothetical protein
MTRLALTLLVALAAPLAAQGRERDSGTVPQDHRPPPGMCRIWIDGVPAGRQPAPTDCPTAIRKKPPNARVIFGDELRTPPRLRDDRNQRHPDKREGEPPRDTGAVKRPERPMIVVPRKGRPGWENR